MNWKAVVVCICIVILVAGAGVAGWAYGRASGMTENDRLLRSGDYDNSMLVVFIGSAVVLIGAFILMSETIFGRGRASTEYAYRGMLSDEHVKEKRKGG